MSTALANRPSAAPLPTGRYHKKRAANHGAVTWPSTDNYLWAGPGAGGDPGEVGPFSYPDWFWLRVGASIIGLGATGGWDRVDYTLKLLVDGAYAGDAGGRTKYTKATWTNSANWTGFSIEGLFQCLPDKEYRVRLLSASAGGNASYYQSVQHYNLWAHTLGEGCT
jgi:hypothetical protein